MRAFIIMGITSSDRSMVSGLKGGAVVEELGKVRAALLGSTLGSKRKNTCISVSVMESRIHPLTILILSVDKPIMILDPMSVIFTLDICCSSINSVGEKGGLAVKEMSLLSHVKSDNTVVSSGQKKKRSCTSIHVLLE